MNAPKNPDRDRNAGRLRPRESVASADDNTTFYDHYAYVFDQACRKVPADISVPTAPLEALGDDELRQSVDALADDGGSLREWCKSA